MKINKFIIFLDLSNILITFGLFILLFFEMKLVCIIYDRILNNLFLFDFHPIQKLFLGRSECQENETFPLINYIFPGINENCYDNNSHSFLNSLCSEDKDNYISIKQIKEKNLTIWRNKIICAKYFNYDNSFYKLINYERNKTCDINYKKCGYLNKLANNKKIHMILCIKQNIECPLNFINITSDTSPYENNNLYDIFSFENGYYLITSNKIYENSVITKIAMAEGKYPCYEKNKYSNSTPEFPSINNIKNFQCSRFEDNEKEEREIDIKMTNIYDNENETILIKNGFDVRYIKFDSQIKRDVFRDNDMEIVYSLLPNISNWQQDMYTSYFNIFYQINFVVKEECEKFPLYESSIISLKNVQMTRVIFELFHILMYVLLFSILGLIKVIISWRHSLLFILKVSLSLIIFGINFVLIIYSSDKIEDFKDFHSLEECLDEVSKAILYEHDINLITNELLLFYEYEKYIWFIYLSFNALEILRLLYKIYKRFQNAYKRNIAYSEIGAENLKKIFEKVRSELDKKKKE